MKKNLLLFIVAIMAIACVLIGITGCEFTPNGSGSEGVVYDISSDGTYAEVVGYTGTETRVNIASTYNNLPVKSIYKDAFKDLNIVSSVIIPNSVTSIGDRAFQGCQRLSNITIGNGVESIGSGVFDGCDELISVTCPTFAISYIPKENLKTIVVTSGEKIEDNAFAQCLKLENVTIAGVTTIGTAAFDECTGLTSVTIGDGVTSIGDYAFRYCEKLTNLTIGDGVKSIGDVAFGVSGLTSVEIPDSVTHVGMAAFVALNLTNINVSENNNSYKSIDGDLYSKDGKVLIQRPVGKKGSNLVISDGVTSIGDMAVYGCIGLTSVTIPDSVTSIGYYAFGECYGLINATIGSGVTSIGDLAFGDSYKLVEVYNKSALNITAGSEDYGYVARYAKAVYTKPYTSKLSTVNDYIIYTDGDNKILVGYVGNEINLVLPEGITEINQGAFQNCSGLTSIIIPDSVTIIGDRAFFGCVGLISVTIGNSVTGIGRSAFSWCGGLTSVTIPDSVTSIGNSAFWKCSGLVSVIIGRSVTSIGDEAFDSCDGLTNVYYKGTATEWNTIEIDSISSDNLSNAKRYYYSEAKPSTSGNYWHYDGNGKVVEW